MTINITKNGEEIDGHVVDSEVIYQIISKMEEKGT